MMNILENSKLEGTHLNIIKAVYEKPKANIIINREMLEAVPLKSVMIQSCSLSLLSLNIVLKVLSGARRKRSDKKGCK